MNTRSNVTLLRNALPFWLSLGLIPLAWIGATQGGWTLLLLPFSAWYLSSILDAILGLNLKNADLETSEDDLLWYRAITMLWAPIQFITLFGLIWYVGHTDHLSILEKIVLFFGVGIITGTIGMVYSHELMHQKNKEERFLGDLLLSMVLYSHFRTEHLKIHHRYVGTPRDTVTARYGEGFYRFFFRVQKNIFKSAFRVEKEMLARKDLPWVDLSNPFFVYWGLQGFMILLAFLLGGWAGLALFLFQAINAIFQLELTNYVEHYGLTRKHLGDGKYEHVKPHHSWNAAHTASNWLLINLQRHSDHHYKPDRRFPLLQNHNPSEAPQLPYGYPLMTLAALFPSFWRRVMNPRVRKWRGMYYPEITDWNAYKAGSTPMPK